MEVRNHTLTLIVNNKPDVLARIAGTFSGRGFNIENISANITLDPTVTKITIVTRGDTATVIKIKKQLKKLVDVISVTQHENGSSQQREMILFRIETDGTNAREITETAEKAGCSVISSTSEDLVIEWTGTAENADHVIKLLSTYSIRDMSRSGIVAL